MIIIILAVIVSQKREAAPVTEGQRVSRGKRGERVTDERTSAQADGQRSFSMSLFLSSALITRLLGRSGRQRQQESRVRRKRRRRCCCCCHSLTATRSSQQQQRTLGCQLSLTRSRVLSLPGSAPVHLHGTERELVASVRASETDERGDGAVE